MLSEYRPSLNMLNVEAVTAKGNEISIGNADYISKEASMASVIASNKNCSKGNAS